MPTAEGPSLVTLANKDFEKNTNSIKKYEKIIQLELELVTTLSLLVYLDGCVLTALIRLQEKLNFGVTCKNRLRRSRERAFQRFS